MKSDSALRRFGVIALALLAVFLGLGGQQSHQAVGQTSPKFQSVPPLQNLFKSGSTPPASCAASSNVVTLSYQLDSVPSSQVGAFEFEILLPDKSDFNGANGIEDDETWVCVNLEPGQYAVDTGMTCFISDVDSGGQPDLPSIGCVFLPPEPGAMPPPSSSLEMAKVLVRPHPGLYTPIDASVNNGVVARLLYRNCELADPLGAPIPTSGCDDAAVTVRYLEGDVRPDCRVDVLDTQTVAFRWGVTIGSLLYNQRYDLEPDGGDGDIDIKDLQFTYGRFASDCARPHPDQPPINPF